MNAQLALALIPVLSLIALGALLSRTTDYFKGPAVSGLVTTVGIPALLLHSVLSLKMDAALMGKLAAVTLLWLIVMALVTAAALAMARQPVRPYLAALVNPNTGNMGIPVCYALFGPAAVAPAMVISSVIQISHFTLGIGCLSGNWSLNALLKNAPLLALAAGFALTATHSTLPEPVMNTLAMLGGITVPVMLMQLGSSVAGLNLKQGKNLLRPVAFGLYRPLAGVAVAGALLLLISLPGQQAQIFMVQCAMPVAVLSYVMAVKYEGPSDDIAVSILLSLPVSLLVAGML